MTSNISGKVVVITGAGSGFGQLVSEMCARRGARVVATDIDDTAVSAVVGGLRAEGGEAIAVQADVTDLAAMQGVAERAVETFGAIDVLVNNAGIMPLAFFADHGRAADAWHRCIAVNLGGVLNGIMAVHDQMISQGRGHVVNISSIYGNAPVVGSGVYSATKAAVNVLSESLRAESQGRIKVSIVRPTGVPGTALGASIINGEALVGLLGQNLSSFMENATAMATGSLPPDRTDPLSIGYWALDPEELAEQILYVIDQPWGISISDITVRAAGDQYLF